ncbi:MAG: hybrid sensor histidine kinase/response regulator [Spirobacillus cienkowskii]|jgi:two-component system NtrC family sensor kinase|uniref:histidine kinase n=1 Tax=Spirobacillus cienkowskii TaxID=495820 RepID=A0A369KVH2_9BACT|nr:MAG: hybrid sensor histidine kinase/response regulator [Spirobacillus cienkowskii]
MEIGQLNIHIVEDDDDLREHLIKEFVSLNHSVSSSQNFYEAKKFIENCGVNQDLFLIDLQLPDGDGFSLINQIRDVNKISSVVIMTAYINHKIFRRAIQHNCYDIVEKPFSVKNDIIPISKRCLRYVFIEKENEYLNSKLLHMAKLADLGELFATVVHDVRGPLATIQLICEDILDEFKKENNISGDFLISNVADIEKATKKINQLIEHLRNYSRNDKGEVEESKNVVELIENSLFLVKQKIKKFGIKVILNNENSDVEIICYPNQFEQMLMNLISNACDSMKNTAKKNLTISSFFENNFLEITIQDTGEGIPQENMPKIFQSFYTTKPKGEGTGLGLSIVKNIVSEHSGELLLNSKVGEGTAFIIKLHAAKVVFNNVLVHEAS